MSEKKKKKKAVTHTTPVGVAKYPYLTKPDVHPTYSPDGVYTVKLVLTGDKAQSLMTKVDAGIEASYEDATTNEKSEAKRKKIKRADAPYTEVEDSDGNETGEIQFNFKLKAVGKSGGKTWKQSPKLFDAKGTPVPKGVEIWGGSEIKVAFEMYEYFMASSKEAGVSLRIKAVQVIKLVSGGSGKAEDFGFAEEEGDDLSNAGSTEEEEELTEDEEDGDF